MVTKLYAISSKTGQILVLKRQSNGKFKLELGTQTNEGKTGDQKVDTIEEAIQLIAGGYSPRMKNVEAAKRGGMALVSRDQILVVETDEKHSIHRVKKFDDYMKDRK